MITRRILVTTVKNADGGKSTIFGRFDPVTITAKGATIVKSEFKNYQITEEEFVEAATEIKAKGGKK